MSWFRAFTHPKPLVASLGAFRSPRAPDDALPEAVEQQLSMLEQLVEGLESRRGWRLPAFPPPGQALRAESRLLLRNLSAANDSFYAVPTEAGHIWCLIGRDSSLARGFAGHAHWSIHWDAGGEMAAAAVHGLVPDDVTRVQVELRDTRHAQDAAVGRNGFYFHAEATEPETAIVGLLLHRQGRGPARVTTDY